MTDSKAFPLADVLSITTDKLLSREHMAGIYKLLNYMTGDDLFTHQLPRAGDACTPALIAQHPFLAALKPPQGADVGDLLVWLAEAERVHGSTITVRPLKAWQHRDHIEEACDLVGADKVWLPNAN